MNTDKKFLYKDLTGEIIEAAFEVHNTLGCGMLEKVYENAIVKELELRGKTVTQQKEFRVEYKGQEVGIYIADVIVEDKVILEVKTVQKIDDVHRAQLLNYLQISGLRVGLLMNFSKPRLQYERLVL